MKNTLLYLLTATGVLITGLVSCKKSEKRATADSVPVINVANPVVDSIVLYKTYPGIANAATSANVVGRVNGTILSKSYDSGTYVKKGQVLFTIEPTKYQEAAAQAAASLATAKSQYEYASKNYAALKEALESDAVSQIEVAQAKATMEQAEASIKDSQAALAQANLNLSYCTVTAPISGYVTSNTMDPGNYISGEGSPVTLCTIYDTDNLTAVFNIEDTQYENMKGINGGKDAALYRNIPIEFAQNLPHTYTADLFYESPTISTSTGTLTLKGTIKNINNELKDGMYITVKLPYGENPKAILIKDASIGTDQLGKYVYVVNDSNKIVYTPIKIGDVYQDSLRVVNDGLKPTDQYVTEALLSVRSGMEVKPNLVK